MDARFSFVFIVPNGTITSSNGHHKEHDNANTTPTQSQEHQNKKCLIVGGSAAQWIRLSYCLARRGYKRIAIIPREKSSSLLVRHSRILLVEHATDFIELKSFDLSKNLDTGSQDIFIFDHPSFAEDISCLLDTGTLNDCTVTFLSSGSTQFSRKCERWNREGPKVRAVFGVKDVPLHTTETYLDWILSSAASSVSVLNRSSFSVTRRKKCLTETHLLPASSAELQTLGALIRRCSGSPFFRKLPNRCSERPTSEVNAVFFIKGVHGTATSDLVKLGAGLLAPLVEVTLQADCGSLDAVAQEVVQEIQRRGPYNLAGDAICTDVVLKVARILEVKGFASVVFLQSEEVENVRRDLQMLKEEDGLGESVLECCLGGSLDPKDWKTLNCSLMAWVDQVEAALSKIACCDPNYREDIADALCHVYQAMQHITEAPETVTLDHGIVHLLKDGEGNRMREWGDRPHEHVVVSLHQNPEGIAEVISQNLATSCLQLELDKVRKTGLS